MHVHIEHDSVERERSHDGNGQATPEGPVAAFAVDVSGVRPPRLAARRRERVRLHPGLDRVERHVVPRGDARDTAGKQHDACKQSAVFVNVRHSTVSCARKTNSVFVFKCANEKQKTNSRFVFESEVRKTNSFFVRKFESEKDGIYTDPGRPVRLLVLIVRICLNTPFYVLIRMTNFNDLVYLYISICDLS